MIHIDLINGTCRSVARSLAANGQSHKGIQTKEHLSTSLNRISYLSITSHKVVWAVDYLYQDSTCKRLKGA